MTGIVAIEQARQALRDRVRILPSGGDAALRLRRLRSLLEEAGIHCDDTSDLQDLDAVLFASERGVEAVVAARLGEGERLVAYARLVAQSQHPVPRLVLAGRAGPDAAPLLARAAEPPLAGRVDFPGYVDPDHRLDVYDRAVLLVIPSHTEGFGIPALEAMTRGIPVVAANRGALPEVVGTAGRLIDPDDAEALRHAIAEVLQNRAERDRMREAGWQQARRFTWHDSAREIREAWAMAHERRQAERD